MLGWPATRFERAYEAMLRREVVRDLKNNRDRMVAAVWANSNYDPQEEGQEPPRTEIIDRIEEQYEEAVARIYADPEETLADEIDWDDPFFAASRRATDKIKEEMEALKPAVSDDDLGNPTGLPITYDQSE